MIQLQIIMRISRVNWIIFKERMNYILNGLKNKSLNRFMTALRRVMELPSNLFSI